MQYIFVFGRDPELSSLELKSYFDLRDIKYKIIDASDMAAVVDIPEIDFKALVARLGGTVKIAKIGYEGLYLGSRSRIRYAVSNYGSKNIEKLMSDVKKQLKQERLKAMLKQPKRNTYLSPSESLKVMEEGFEIVAYKDFVGKTIACSNPRKYEERDSARPRQRHEQMISIRLAKMLINIAAKPNDTLLDPFCGYGVVLQEAMLLGYDAIGVDMDKSCVNAARKNLEWLKKRYGLKKSFKVMQGDSRQLSSLIKKAGCVATEPYLGPVLKKLPTRELALKSVKELTKLYSEVLKEFKKVVKGRIVIIMPRFRLHTNERIKIDFIRLIKESRLNPITKLPIIYTAPNSKIEREIWVISS